MITFKRTDHVNVCVPIEKIEEAHTFYADVLGLTPKPRPDHVFDTPGYWFALADIEFHVGVEPVSGNTFRHTAFEVTDLSACRQHLIENGISIDEQPFIEGRDRFMFSDPFGNRMELLEYFSPS
ncbi:VOC family protein [Mucilaginibacter antarcticus]|uniref:VOC family protein n=1 Tax=Mucilaginibacter antarcticus TaxID=1855725 RepID=A0ABW5XPV4_9SPHI